MAKKGAISKSMRKKKQVPAKKKNGGLSKKDKTYMKEFGFLNFDDQENHDTSETENERFNHLQSRLGGRTIYLNDDAIHPSELQKNHSPSLSTTNTKVTPTSTTIDTFFNETEWINESNNKENSITVDPLKKLFTTMNPKRKKQLLQKFQLKKEKQMQKQSKAMSSMVTKLSLVKEHGFETGLDSEDKVSMFINEELSDPEDNEESNYDVHFNNDCKKNEQLQALVQQWNMKTLKWNSIPLSEIITLSSILPSTELNHVTEKFKTLFSTLSSSSSSSSSSSPAALMYAEKRMKPRIWNRYLTSLSSSSSSSALSPLFSNLFPMMSSYHDVLYTSPLYVSEASTLQSLYILHALNHVYKSRNKVWKGSLKLQAFKKETDTKTASTTTATTKTKKKDSLQTTPISKPTDSTSSVDNATEPIEIRDQGFTRPTVIMVFPFRNMAYDAVHTLLKYSGTSEEFDEPQLQRFEDEFGGEPYLNSKKPLDFQHLFRRNTDDCFRLGLQLTKKTLKLYTPFYHSDFLIASPLGLRTLIETEKDHDYLSSLELVILDGSHIMNMQNWEHVVFLMKLLNKIPKKPGECDFSRVKPYFIENLSKYFRQTLIFSEYVFPDLLNLFHTQAFNLVSGLRFQFRTPTKVGAMLRTSLPIPHTFIKLSTDFLKADDTRFQYFIDTLLPTFRRSSSSSSTSVSLQHQHRLIFFPSYFEYVRVRNYMDQHDYEFEVANEYGSQSDLMRSRTLFQQHRTPILLYTERLHFFKRLVIQGCLHLVFYGVPENSMFYSECVHFISHMNSFILHASITTLFTPWDAIKLERIVGQEKIKEMMEQPGPFIYQKV